MNRLRSVFHLRPDKTDKIDLVYPKSIFYEIRFLSIHSKVKAKIGRTEKNEHRNAAIIDTFL